MAREALHEVLVAARTMPENGERTAVEDHKGAAGMKLFLDWFLCL